MKQNHLGDNITRFRKEKGLSQEKVAEYMEVSRQAVTKWESSISKPSSDNLLKLAELLGVSVDILLGNCDNRDKEEPESVKTGKAPWILIGVSIVCVIVYMVASNLLAEFSFATLLCVFIICVPIQLFLHIYFSNAINNNAFTGIAGFSDKIEYNYSEVKKLLLQMDLQIGMSSSVYIFLICAIGCTQLSIPWINVLLLTVYMLNFMAIILYDNYRFIDKIYCNEVDKKRSMKGIPIIIIYFLLMLLGMGIIILVFEVKGIENNTVPAMKVGGSLLGGLLFATIGFLVENSNVNKWDPDNVPYRVNKVSVISLLVCLLFYGLMCII